MYFFIVSFANGYRVTFGGEDVALKMVRGSPQIYPLFFLIKVVFIIHKTFCFARTFFFLFLG